MMATEKVYAVLLTHGAADELGDAFNTFVKNKGNDAYIYAKSIDSEGNYFHMTVDQEILPGDNVEVELLVHHEFITGSFCAGEAEMRELGFL
jgi:hypothetical protein